MQNQGFHYLAIAAVPAAPILAIRFHPSTTWR